SHGCLPLLLPRCHWIKPTYSICACSLSKRFAARLTSLRYMQICLLEKPPCLRPANFPPLLSHESQPSSPSGVVRRSGSGSFDSAEPACSDDRTPRPRLRRESNEW